ncbi:T9SS type A sorting domain-containing protein [Flavilitoribacter nigricans]|uniref:Cytochrome c domain-containing protein n=1 Tax=Flavilitoribacter nigricans (strain ATCC 23147 / DSM 23189 / NBRC 102662 / NCIMB 1420 / SS-2) TaxID=1122177 RepID=A0A2D0ND07_FLAN2|nr:T9SS type A sorting domain-containing protein [Flavilitoribacter nigricans]PHN06391.1 hypothetical protein CRP01_12540 [Flavilitoribacter nigricans DSM 23189 = NBRC 102662]
MKHFALLLFITITSFVSVKAQVPNWSENVACIIYNNCASCHTTGGIAPFPLLSYDDVKLYAGLIKSVVSEGIMPPWPPDPDYHPLADERILTDAEIRTIVDWVDGGTPAGDLLLAPDPPDNQGAEVIADPDLVVQLPAYTSKAVNGDEYRCFVFPSELLEDRFITGFEVIPGNRNIVHHVLVFQDQSDRALQLDAGDPAPGYLCFGGVGSNSAEMIGAWVPGQGAQYLPRDMGIRIPAGSNIVVQLHYPEGSAGEVDNTKINFQLSDRSDLREVNVDFILNHFTSMVNGPLYIPANTVKTFRQEFKTPVPVTVIGVAPHMHLIGRSIKTWAQRPDGSIIPLIDIPEWDFEWQGFYRFQEPVTIPAGSFLRSEAVYDNTSANPHNPNDPPLPVSVGEATTDEMMLVTFTWLFYDFGDEQLSLEPEVPVNGYSCNAISTDTNDPAEWQSLTLSPNPAREQIRIELENEWNGLLELSVRNTFGQLLKSRSLEKSGTRASWNLQLDGLPPGVYLLQLTNGKKKIIKRMVIN